jgi:AP-1 complex subunit mu
MISSLLILDLTGKVILSRNYRDGVSATHADSFMRRIIDDEDNVLGPIFEVDGKTDIHIKHNNLYFVAVTEMNSDAMMVLNFLYKLVEVFKEYFKQVEEESIRDNFVITYELLDEVLDFGYPQTTEASVLKSYITQQGHELIKPTQPLPAITRNVCIHAPQPTYVKNEIFLDIIERVNMQMSTAGPLVHAEIVGKIAVKSQLSGMPEVRIVLNDRINFKQANTGDADEGSMQKETNTEVVDVTLNQCVRKQQFEEQGTLCFVPPDGSFELMSYRLSKPIKPVITVECAVNSHPGSRVEYVIKAKAQFKSRSTANDVVLTIPVPTDCDTPQLKASVGAVSYEPEQNAMVWKIKHLQGGQEVTLHAQFGLSSTATDDKSRRPISVAFDIPYVAASGLQVRQLKVIERSGYKALPWVRYMTQAGDYTIKI